MVFMVVDNRSTYQGVLGRPALKELWAITSIHNLCMKFPIQNDIATVKDQRSVKECYSNSFRKVETKDVNVILIDIDENDDLEQG